MQQQIQTGIQQLMQKDMDRKDFMKHVAIGFVALTGVAAAIKTVSQINTSQKPMSGGYGSSAYGGGSSSRSIFSKK